MICDYEASSSNLFKLLHLVSPTLPVGSFSYSQSLEWWIDKGTVNNEDTLFNWLLDLINLGQIRSDLIFFKDAYMSSKNFHLVTFKMINEKFLASRETKELRSETLQMGYSLKSLIPQLITLTAEQNAFLNGDLAYPVVWAFLANNYNLSLKIAIQGFLWSWLENLVIVAVKTIPLGQNAGQRVLVRLTQYLETIMNSYDATSHIDPITVLPGLAISSSNHERLYTRLFRS